MNDILKLTICSECIIIERIIKLASENFALKQELRKLKEEGDINR